MDTNKKKMIIWFSVAIVGAGLIGAFIMHCIDNNKAEELKTHLVDSVTGLILYHNGFWDAMEVIYEMPEKNVRQSSAFHELAKDGGSMDKITRYEEEKHDFFLPF